MENKNQNNNYNQMCDYKSYMLGKRKKRNRILVGVFASLFTLALGFTSYLKPNIFSAALTPGAMPVGTDNLYIPSYSGNPGSEGTISIITEDGIAADTFDAITFTLHYSPVNALIFDSNPIVLSTAIPNSALELTSSPEPGSLNVVLIGDTTNLILGADETLFSLATQVNPDMPVGQTITMSVDNVAVMNGGSTVPALDNIETGSISLAGQAELKVLNAEAIDSTHVAVTFSDYLSNIGVIADYEITPGPIAPTLVQLGSDFGGYDQKTVVLTFPPTMTAGTQYTLTVDSPGNVEGNTQLGVHTNYDSAILFGYGQASTSLSSFGMVSAAVSNYNTITVTFTDAVSAASVSKSDFTLTGTGAPTISNISSVSSNQVTLVVDGALLKQNTYLLSLAGGQTIQRASDGANLGIDRVAFNGTKNGPSITSASITETSGVYTLRVNFDENITVVGGGAGEVGQLFTTASGIGTGTTINNTTTNYTVGTNYISFSDVGLNSATTNFTFSVTTPAWITNSYGVSMAEENRLVSFWGYGHTSTTNNIGTASVTKKDVIVVNQGSGATRLNFSGLTTTNVQVLENDTSGDNLTPVLIDSVGVVNDNLQIELINVLEPNINYIVRIYNGTGTLAVAETSVPQNLNVTTASAVSSTQVRVNFSENIDERDIDATDFTITPALAVSGVTIDPGYQSVTLTAAAQTAGTVYSVVVSGSTTGVYAYGGNALGKTTAAFGGYGTSAAISSTTLSSVQATSGTTLRLTFSDAVDPTTVTPVNIKIQNSVGTQLTITGVTQVNSSTYDLTTAKQTANTNYFVVMQGVKDVAGLAIGNAKVLNFLGFQLPSASVSTVLPRSIVNDEDTEVILAGQNLDSIATVSIGTTQVEITEQTSSALTILVPADFVQGSYDIKIVDDEGTSYTLPSGILISVPVIPFSVVSSESKAIPYKVPNDGTTKTKLWVLVRDPVSIANVSSVVVDLSQIGGMSTVEMQKDTGTQPQYGQWYTYEVAVPDTVATSSTPYLLPVEARKGSEVVSGTLGIMVTGDVYESVAPTIDQLYVSPLSVSPKSGDPIRISAQISDEDGADTIVSVVADMGSLGIGFVPLTAVDTGTGKELVTKFFQSEEFTISSNVDEGDYTINVTALDDTGESTTQALTFTVSTTLTGPVINSTKSYLAPRKSVPNDGVTAFSIYAFVSDEDGVGDISSVTASFGILGLPPVSLQKAADTADTALSAWYSVEGLTVPKTSPTGVHNIEVTAEDSSGGVSNLILQLDVTYKDMIGDPPFIKEDESYTTPAVAINDGETPITIYAFVRDDDDDLDSVILNLSSIGQVGPEVGSGLTETGSTDSEVSSDGSGGNCPTGSNVIVCMKPSVKEGKDGQWFILPGVTINKSTMPSSNPYEIDIIATDATGKTDRGKLSVSVNDGNSFTNDAGPPKMLVAVPTSSTTLEIQFNEELQASSISSSGKEFIITDKNNVNNKLAVVGATINATGTIVTLSTANQEPGKEYVVNASDGVKDALGSALVAGASNRKIFYGFKSSNQAPTIEYISATDIDTVEIEFRDNLLPSSLVLNAVTANQEPLDSTLRGRALNIEIVESGGTSEKLEVLGVEFGDSGNVIKVKTATQKPEQRYRMMIKGISAYDGTQPTVTLNKLFKGYDARIAQRRAASNLADLNNDGKVDFLDFTIFSSVYGTIYINSTSAEQEASSVQASEPSGGQPIPDTPDSTVPHTSEPAGGEVTSSITE